MKYIVANFDKYKYSTKYQSLVCELMKLDFLLIDINDEEEIYSILNKNNSDDIMIIFQTQFNPVFTIEKSYNCKISYIYDDVHYKEGKIYYLSKLINKIYPHINNIFSNDDKPIYNYLHEHKKFTYLPPFAAHEFDISIDLNPVNKILLSGFVHRNVYPHRYNIKYNVCKQKKYKKMIDVLEHPGYIEQKHNIVGSNYANYLAKYKCCIGTSGCLIFANNEKKYVLVTKIIEICCVGSLLLCDDDIMDEMTNLGFVPDKHYISFNMENLRKKIDWILDSKNDNEILDIRKNGQKLVKDNHLAIHRAKFIAQQIM